MAILIIYCSNDDNFVAIMLIIDNKVKVFYLASIVGCLQVRIGTFNAENMFERDSAINLPSWEDDKRFLKDFEYMTN